MADQSNDLTISIRVDPCCGKSFTIYATYYGDKKVQLIVNDEKYYVLLSDLMQLVASMYTAHLVGNIDHIFRTTEREIKYG